MSLTRGEGLGIGLLAGAALIASLAAAPGVAGVMGGGLALIMLGVAVFDRRSLIIPDELNVAAFALGLCDAAILGPSGVVDGVLAALARGVCVAAVFLAVRVGYQRLRGREGLGLGDVKLAGVAGAWLDWPLIPIAVEVAALAALGAYLLHQRSGARSLRAAVKLPFGLFFAPAIWLCWLVDATLLRV